MTETTSVAAKCGLCDAVQPCVLVRAGKVFWCCRGCAQSITGCWARAARQQPETFSANGPEPV